MPGGWQIITKPLKRVNTAPEATPVSSGNPAKQKNIRHLTSRQKLEPPRLELNFRGILGHYGGVKPSWILFLFLVMDAPSVLAAQSSGPPSAAPAAAAEQASSQAPVDETAVKKLFLAGESALAANDLEDAEKDFRRVLALEPQSPGAYANLGTVYMRREQWPQAIALLRKAERLAPNVAGVRLNIGLAYYRQNDYAAAIPVFESVVRDQPDSSQARYLLGLCYFFKKRYSDATRDLDGLWQQESNQLAYLYVLGVAANKAHQPQIEEKSLTRLVELGKDTALFHLFMGKAYLNRQDDDKAIAEFEHAAQQDPKLPFLHFNLGLAYMKKREYDKARAEFENDVALEPEVAFNYDQLATIYSDQQQDAPAEKNFLRAVKLDPRLASSYFGLAKVYQREGKDAEALWAITSAEKLAPDNSSVHYVRGEVLLHLVRREQGRQELAVASKLMKSLRDQQREKLDREQLPSPELTEP